MHNKERLFPRREVHLYIKIYSKLIKGSHSVLVKNLAKGGAFISDQHFPQIGEIISYELLDETYRPFFMGNAKVCRHQSDSKKENRGYGIMFLKALPDEIYEGLTK